MAGPDPELVITDDHPGAMDEYNAPQEAAEPRTIYGTSRIVDFASMLPSAGDPMFATDGQNNDEFYAYDSDVPRDVDDTSQPEY